MKVIIAGSRSIQSYEDVIRAISLASYDITEVVSGCASGVDMLGEAYAEQHFLDLMEFPADWNTHGKSAGYKRNVEMGEYADALIAIWDGQSRGTSHMIDIMKELGKPVTVVKILWEVTTYNGKE